MNYKYVATCLFGLEGLLGEEIDRLGYHRIETIDGRIIFEGGAEAAARCNINLRFAERIYLLIGMFSAYSFAELFEKTRDLPLEEYFDKTDEYPVSGHSVRSTLFSVTDCQRIIKKAVSVRLGKAYGVNILPENGVRKRLEFFILKDRVMLMIELSGTPLHKRGYRPETVAAPLRETLAAAIVKLSRPRENVLLRDPFCGSGTIAIEGAMMMNNIAPGLNRCFAAEKFSLFPSETWTSAREEARESIIRDSVFEAYGSDIDKNCVRIAEESARRAGVEKSVRFEAVNAFDITTENRRGTIVTNPPYGERLLTEAEVTELYRQMGEHFKTLDKWQFYILTPNEMFPKLFGRRADKIRKLYNGMIPCFLYQFFKNADGHKEKFRHNK
ncbi:MAG: class I SAM-dependent RNA methyltransferase [Clostridiales bacterium]|nr:class I SAM-dependent RNA methyltransferase [Clostridiales bacterium]